MAGYDGKGPEGLGPTGRGMGPCGGGSAGSFGGGRLGRGLGRGRGGRRWFWRSQQTDSDQALLEAEKSRLEQQLAAVQSALDIASKNQ